MHSEGGAGGYRLRAVQTPQAHERAGEASAAAARQASSGVAYVVPRAPSTSPEYVRNILQAHALPLGQVRAASRSERRISVEGSTTTPVVRRSNAFECEPLKLAAPLERVAPGVDRSGGQVQVLAPRLRRLHTGGLISGDCESDKQRNYGAEP